MMYQKNLWPQTPGINIITEINSDYLYIIPQSQTLVFPFSVSEPVTQIKIAAGHTSFYDNQQGTILAWASKQPAGRSITGEFNSNLANVNLQGDGYTWLFYLVDNQPNSIDNVDLVQWILPDTQYFMCFKNLENKNNGLYCRIDQLCS